MLRTAFVLSLLACAVARAESKTFTVAIDGSGDFKTVQEAVAAAPANAADRTTIRIKPGEYMGPFVIAKDKPNLSFVGDNANTTVLFWPHNVKGPKYDEREGFNAGLLVKADGFRAENITIANTSGEWGQGLAAKVDGDKAAFTGCRFLGWQDTLMTNNGRHYFKDCYLEGRVDFIYGSGTAVFDRCKIHSKNGGYITAASTPQEKPFGFVFLDCTLTGDDKPWNPATSNPATTQPMSKPNKPAYFGRPWRPYAAVAFIRCDIGDHIRPEGWHNWGKPANEQTARYREYNNTGPGAKTAGRVKWAGQLTDEQAATYTVANIFGDWKPSE